MIPLHICRTIPHRLGPVQAETSCYCRPVAADRITALQNAAHSPVPETAKPPEVRQSSAAFCCPRKALTILRRRASGTQAIRLLPRHYLVTTSLLPRYYLVTTLLLHRYYTVIPGYRV